MKLGKFEIDGVTLLLIVIVIVWGLTVIFGK
jgi:hypothetical protein